VASPVGRCEQAGSAAAAAAAEQTSAGGSQGNQPAARMLWEHGLWPVSEKYVRK